MLTLGAHELVAEGSDGVAAVVPGALLERHPISWVRFWAMRATLQDLDLEGVTVDPSMVAEARRVLEAWTGADGPMSVSECWGIIHDGYPSLGDAIRRYAVTLNRVANGALHPAVTAL